MKGAIHRIWFGLILLALIILACNRVKDVILPHTYDIFPVENGKYRISLVTDTSFNTQGPILDQYFKREEVIDTTTDLNGRILHRVWRFRSELDDSTAYQFAFDRSLTFYINPDDGPVYFAERNEENQRTLVLKFPVSLETTWNGNQFNNLPDETFFYHRLDTTVVLNGTTYPNCVMVVQQADTTGRISYRYTYEIYAPNIGMIKRFSRIIVNDGPNGEFNPDVSRHYVEEIVEHN